MSSKIYTLGYTGPEVDEAIAKIQDLDVSALGGGIIELESTEANPYNLDFLRVVGIYKAAYVYAVTAPTGVSEISPVYIYVSKVNDGSESGKLVQTLNAAGMMYTRESTNAGQTWGIWDTNDGFDSAQEITAEEVDQIFADVFGTDTAVVYSLLNASRAVSHKSTSAPTTVRSIAN